MYLSFLSVPEESDETEEASALPDSCGTPLTQINKSDIINVDMALLKRLKKKNKTKINCRTIYQTKCCVSDRYFAFRSCIRLQTKYTIL